MQSTKRTLTIVLLALTAAIWMGGCPSGTSGTTTDPNTLTDAEKNAATTAARAVESLAQATGTAQSTTNDPNDQSAFTIPTGVTERTFGNCPEVAFTLSNDDLLTFNLTIDFGTGCTPVYLPEYACAGAASGTFDQRNQNIQMTFNTITCGVATLTGDVNLDYERDASKVALDGAWDLTYVDSVGTVVTDGNGNCEYDRTAYITTIPSFTGTITAESKVWSATCTGIVTSFYNNSVFMPYAGQVTLTGPDIRDITIKFDEDSPTTGVVQVSVGGGPFFAVGLYSL